jgi:hypothetical protein
LSASQISSPSTGKMICEGNYRKLLERTAVLYGRELNRLNSRGRP